MYDDMIIIVMYGKLNLLKIFIYSYDPLQISYI